MKRKASAVQKHITTYSLLSLLCFVFFAPLNAAETDDPHYSKAGFFDLHLCHWPDRPPFFKAVFSTFEFDNLKYVSIENPDGSEITKLDTSSFIEFRSKGRKKRAFLQDHELADTPKAGWYTAKIHLKDGTVVEAKDYVDPGQLPLAEKIYPEEAQEVTLPVTIRWKPIEGATHYKLVIRDIWNNRKIAFRTKVITDTEVTVPDGKLEVDGEYEWLVHARDVDGDPILGDFNLGSQTAYSTFTVIE
ncbi:hypothetical protein [Solemya velum gill symbiont]|uniref:Uncharacterized protein n=1 Tax=Solemya velum gill symbiont TaxID=2340 RepID=A0A0B0HAS4_SOVGS|nr:hypothetical protein [Solemya velum gill symbiont]KHF24536.1 hypothetical protein JV46_25660 [Solemya velum gill symbiont]OOY49564.1 hypothetical protein BOV97_12720 [Solemya velum gill symbiont]OOY54116.1 hypothetical protein BOV99_12125 [Solemya velum gill symbiont]OOY54158.1 hypothetical protein BOW00_12130 [Solemya velum gill symbiont]OOY58896.1 hypothetical protein BOW02_12175 [Solemya velum gill symbiont]